MGFLRLCAPVMQIKIVFLVADFTVVLREA